MAFGEPRLPGWALLSNGAGDTWSPQHSLWCPGVSEPITFQPGRSGHSLAREILTLRLGLGRCEWGPAGHSKASGPQNHCSPWSSTSRWGSRNNFICRTPDSGYTVETGVLWMQGASIKAVPGQAIDQKSVSLTFSLVAS